jgi:hypothetical protein
VMRLLPFAAEALILEFLLSPDASYAWAMGRSVAPAPATRTRQQVIPFEPVHLERCYTKPDA